MSLEILEGGERCDGGVARCERVSGHEWQMVRERRRRECLPNERPASNIGV